MIAVKTNLFQLNVYAGQADLLVESFDALNDPSLHFTLTAPISNRKRSLFLTTGAGTDSAP
jgi:hypothetical protein